MGKMNHWKWIAAVLVAALAFAFTATNAGPSLFARTAHAEGLLEETEDNLQQVDSAVDVVVDDLELTKEVTGAQPVPPTGVITNTIRLKNNGGAPVKAQIRDVLEWPIHPVYSSNKSGDRALVHVQERSAGVIPLNARVQTERLENGKLATIISWNGGLAAGAEVELTFQTHPHVYCGPDQTTKDVINRVVVRAMQQDGTVITNNLERSVTFAAQCLGTRLDDITIEQSLVTDSSNAGSAAIQAENVNLYFEDSVRTVREAIVSTSLTNNGPDPVRVGFSLNFETLTGSDGQAVVNGQNGSCQILDLEPGETASVKSPRDAASGLAVALATIPDDTENPPTLSSAVRLQILPHDAERCNFVGLEQGQIKQQSFELKIRPYDVGDAPDSTNHASNPMPAYTGVQATFPTVFDPATGAPPGPAHARPRPFHLGKGVEFEIDADLLPAPRNINPVTDVPDRDRFDDGAQPSAWTLNECQPTNVQVQVYVSPKAASWFAEKGREGYLNGWIDSNRDGDWADGRNCTAPDGAQRPALEHIIIDYPVDAAALGAGLHTLTVPTGAVLWPSEKAQQNAWVRLTLSEDKSNKPLNTLGIQHGDGRGFAKPFRTGETEDYLLRPEGSADHKPILSIDISAGRYNNFGSQPGTNGATAGPDAVEFITYGAEKLAVKIDYSNVGPKMAESVTLSFNLPTQWPAGTQFKLASQPDLGLPTGFQTRANVAALLQNLAVGDLEPGEGGTIILTVFEPNDANTAQAAANPQLKVTGKASNVALDSEVTYDLIYDKATPLIFGVKPANGQAYVQGGGTTCSDSLSIKGVAQPGTDVRVWTDMRPLGTDADPMRTFVDVKANANGVWTAALSGLADGRYQFYACTLGDVECVKTVAADVDVDKSTPKLAHARVIVDSSLLIDPMTILMTDKNGRTSQLATLPWTLAGGNVPSLLDTGEANTMTASLCNNEVIEGSFEVNSSTNGSKTATLSPDGNGNLTGIFTDTTTAQSAALGAGKASLTLISGGQGSVMVKEMELIEANGPAKVVDPDGKPIDGAAITLYVTRVAGDYPSGDMNARIVGNSAEVPGLKLTTDTKGEYSVFVPGRIYVYRLVVEKPGYQTYVSGPIQPQTSMASIAPQITLWPMITGDELGPLFEVDITDAGFGPPELSAKCCRCLTCTVAAGEVMPAVPDRGVRCLTCTFRIRNMSTIPQRIMLETVNGFGSAQAANSSSGETGEIPPGESAAIVVSLTQDDYIELQSLDDPTIHGAVIPVDAAEPDGPVYLPSMYKR